MDCTQVQQGDRVTVNISGKLNFKDHSAFNAMLSELVEKEKDVTIDLSKLEVIDSAGIGMLFLANKLITRNGRSMSIANPQGQVRRVFEITSIDNHIKVIMGGE